MKNYKYIKYFPKPFLEDLVNGRTIPIVGAGFSKNAEIPKGKSMLAWDELGKAIADEIEDYKYSNAIDAISAYCHEYSRTKLVEKLTTLLLVNSVKPGTTHKAFCELQFDIVCTTNFEFLIEDGYKLTNKYCRPIIEEDQLSISINTDNVILLKLHGDLHHPNRLVATEEDYDAFLSRYPMLATYLANLLISRTPFFIGYSLDDTDFRQIWQLIKDRLGSLRRQAYVLKVDCSSHEKARFERRGVKVINIKGKASDYPIILKEIFEELREYWNSTLVESYMISEDNAMAELSLPNDVQNRLCFFSVPLKLMPFYKKYIFPIARRVGLVPLSADDVISSGDNWFAKTAALIEKAEFIVVDASTQNTILELGIATRYIEKQARILIIKDDSTSLHYDWAGYGFLKRSRDIYDNLDELINPIENWFFTAVETLGDVYQEEPVRLLKKKEYRAAVISAVSLLEAHIRKQISQQTELKSNKSLYSLINLALDYQLIDVAQLKDLKEWMNIRNHAVHSKVEVSYQQARKIVNGIMKMISE